MEDTSKTCAICGNQLDKINKWKEHELETINFLTGERTTVYICDRCYKNKISKLLKNNHS